MSGFSLESEFYCCKCGNKGIPIARIKGREREAGHLKKLFCLTCQREWNHVECKPFSHYSKEDFDIEFREHNFDENGNRIMSYGDLRSKLNAEGRL